MKCPLLFRFGRKYPTPKRFGRWGDAGRYLGKEIVVEPLIDGEPAVEGKMNSIEVVNGFAFITILGSNVRYEHYRCRPKK